MSNDDTESQEALELAEFSNEVLDDLGGSADRYKGLPVPPVLIVDDDPEVLGLFEEQFNTMGRTFVCEASALRACDLLTNGGSKFSCVITDYMMPQMNGLELLKHASEFQPDAVRILISGQADLKMAVDGINSGSIFRFLLKPTHLDQLEQVLHDAEAAYSSKIKERMVHADVRKLALWLKAANQRLESNMSQILDLNSYVIDVFSPYLYGVNQVTCALVKEFCDLGFFSPKDSRILKLAAHFHNVGLLGIHRETIMKSFSKENQLSAGQRLLVEAHPAKGSEMVGFVGEAKAVSQIIHAHHERWDGGGYPNGLSTHMIPRLAQYLALASYYAECPYYGGEVIWRIREEKDKAFGAEIIDAFEAVVERETLPPKIREIHPKDCLSGMILARDVMDLNEVRILAAGRELSVAEIRFLRERADDGTLSLPLMVRVHSRLRSRR